MLKINVMIVKILSVDKRYTFPPQTCRGHNGFRFFFQNNFNIALFTEN